MAKFARSYFCAIEWLVVVMGGYWWSAVTRGGRDEFFSSIADDVGFGRGGRGGGDILIRRPLMAEFACFCHCAVEWVVVGMG